MKSQSSTLYTMTDSPIGNLMLTSDGDSLTGVYMELHKGGPAIGAAWRRDDAAMRPTAEALSAYFAGDCRRFDLPLSLRGTEFQRKVWDALLAIPFGETTTYMEIARGIGAPRAVRAVGASVGRNPVSIIVPCHRVVGSSGNLTGFAGGLERKRWLLEHERDTRLGQKTLPGVSVAIPSVRRTA